MLLFTFRKSLTPAVFKPKLPIVQYRNHFMLELPIWFLLLLQYQLPRIQQATHWFRTNWVMYMAYGLITCTDYCTISTFLTYCVLCTKTPAGQSSCYDLWMTKLQLYSAIFYACLLSSTYTCYIVTYLIGIDIILLNRCHVGVPR